MEDNPPWKELIKMKYGLEEGGWFSKVPQGSCGVGRYQGRGSAAETRLQVYPRRWGGVSDFGRISGVGGVR